MAALLIGAAGGPYSLVSAKAAQPAIDWSAISFAFVGCVVGTLLIIGIQIFRRTPNYGQLVLRVFEPLAALVLGSGVGGLVTAAFAKEVGPASMFFLAIGLGLAIGVAISSFVFNARFKNAL